MAHPKAGRPRGKAPSAEVAAREQEVVRLRRGGLTWDLIGERVGLTTSGAYNAYERALKRVIKEDVDAIRQIEGERLDTAQAAIWSNVLQGDTNSVNTLLRIMERRAKLLGLDQPVRIQAEVVNYDGNTIRAELARIITNANSSAALPMGAGVSET